MRKLLFTLVLFSLSVGVASAGCWFDSFYDVRTYDPSHPDYDLVGIPGGWTVGYACDDIPDSGLMPSDIGRVELDLNPSSGMTSKVILSGPACYPWNGPTLCDWTVRYGSKYYFEGGQVIASVYAPDGQEPFDSMDVTPLTTQNKPPFIEIKKMSILKSGEVRMRFTAPYELRPNQIRVRIFDETGNSLLYDQKINPPYQMNGKPDELEILISGEYKGRLARLEYRVWDSWFEGRDYMSRSVTMFKLPALE